MITSSTAPLSDTLLYYWDDMRMALILSNDWQWSVLDQMKFNAEACFCLLPKSLESFSVIDEMTHMDTSGAYYLNQILCLAQQLNLTVTLDLQESHQYLMNVIQEEQKQNGEKSLGEMQYKADKSHSKYLEVLEYVGIQTFYMGRNFLESFNFIGALWILWLAMLFKPRRWRINLLLEVIYHAGCKAVGIVGLLAFLIGVVLTYQVGKELSQYGANIFVVNLLGLSILREFGPLITAIIVAGRSGSAFTAELGAMKMQQETDALITLGISPLERLVLPRIIGLLIALPLLTMFANILAIIGGMCSSKGLLGLSFYNFLVQFQLNVSVKSLLLGMLKAPFFAFIIAVIGCYRGLLVKQDSVSIGVETTKSVVFSIFSIIVADAFFSVLFSLLGL